MSTALTIPPISTTWRKATAGWLDFYLIARTWNSAFRSVPREAPDFRVYYAHSVLRNVFT